MATKKIQILSTDLLSDLGAVQCGRIVWKTLRSDSWIHEGEALFMQEINIEDINKNSKIDIQVDAYELLNNGTVSGNVLCVKNDNGNITVYCYGRIMNGEDDIQKPNIDINVQLYITAVAYPSDKPIWGNSCTI